ncbi:hypothetical protein [Labrenzia sp. PHM005]|uniref:hypothetical protein n=1 Tax=Labrenzia sp. PHM005 TaxID=2590016 RepID=UPI00113FFB83|nr:hypothetical protein [Labrenzia sp. PHM005]QDG75640.1 hypothetical protein FJ695_07075 [Labrenzia sp. PHM005]
MSDRTLDNDRGAKRAEELRRRFQNVSDASFGRRGFSFPSGRGMKGRWNTAGGQGSGSVYKFWLACALLIMAAALFL